MAWKKGPLPEGTYQWGAVVPHDLEGPGFFFADFLGDAAGIWKPDGTRRTLEAWEVKYYDNSIEMPPQDD